MLLLLIEGHLPRTRCQVLLKHDIVNSLTRPASQGRRTEVPGKAVGYNYLIPVNLSFLIYEMGKLGSVSRGYCEEYMKQQMKIGWSSRVSTILSPFQ